MNEIFPEPIYRHGVLRTTKAWRQHKERYGLVGSKCRACGTLWWPGRKVCGKCNSQDMEDFRFSHVGTLLVRHAGQSALSSPPIQGFEVYGDTRIFALVELPEGVYVGPTDLVDCPQEKAKDGMSVHMVLRKLRREANGSWQYGFMWIPAET